MKKKSLDNIQEIAMMLDLDQHVFIHKRTTKTLILPNDIVDEDIKRGMWKEELKELETHSTEYYELEKMSSREAYEMRMEFVEQLKNNKKIQYRLFEALNKKKPFREFRFVVENSGEVRQQWFVFKYKWDEDFIMRQLEELKELNDMKETPSHQEVKTLLSIAPDSKNQIMKDLKGKFVSFKYQDRKNLISGFLIDYNDDWTLIKYNPADFVIDGYLILKSKKILKYKRDDDEEFREKVLNAQKIMPTDKDIFPINDIAETLKLISDRFGAFMIKKKDDSIGFIGRFIKITKDNLIIQKIDAESNWGENEKYKLQSIRTIQFDSDYLNSLIAYNKMTENI